MKDKQLLQHAIQNNDQQLVKKFITENKELLQKPLDKYKNTALMMAVYERSEPIVRILIQAGANLNFRSSDGRTPLNLAIHLDLDNIARLLIKNNANVNAADYIGETPLMKAAQKNNLEIAKMLLLHEADINAKNMHGSTPLDYAYTKDHPEMVALLLDAGADVASLQLMYGGHRNKKSQGLIRAKLLDYLRKKQKLTMALDTKNKGAQKMSTKTAAVHHVVGGGLKYDPYVYLSGMLGGGMPQSGEYISPLAKRLARR